MLCKYENVSRLFIGSHKKFVEMITFNMWPHVVFLCFLYLFIRKKIILVNFVQ